MKLSCGPNLRVVEKLFAYHESREWRKLIKLQPYIEEHILSAFRRVDDPLMHLQHWKILHVLFKAYDQGIEETGDDDNVYTKAIVPLLHEILELQGKMGLYTCLLYTSDAADE